LERRQIFLSNVKRSSLRRPVEALSGGQHVGDRLLDVAAEGGQLAKEVALPLGRAVAVAVVVVAAAVVAVVVRNVVDDVLA